MAWSQEQLQNAAIIARVGKSLGASDRDVVIALMTALQESGLRNLNYGDRDSIGLFQQRDAWGTRSQRLNPAEAARMFFQGGHGGQRGLFAFKNRNQMSLTQAAQAVQVSAFPDAYAKWEDEARALAGGSLPNVDINSVSTTTQPLGLDAMLAGDDEEDPGPQAPPQNPLGAVGEEGSSPLDALEFGGNMQGGEQGSPLDALTFDNAGPTYQSDPMQKLHAPEVSQLVQQVQQAASSGDVSGWRAAVIAAARKMLGTPYVWGGTSYNGVDCSGLLQLIFKEQGISLPRISADQARMGKRVSFDQLKPGDLVAIDNSSRNNGADHIGLFIGNGQVIEAPRPGKNVQVIGLDAFSGGWGVSLNF